MGAFDVSDGDEKLVAFLDVIGFKQMVMDPSQVDLINAYFEEVLSQIKELSRIDSKREMVATLLSDAVVIAFPFRNSIANLRELLVAVAKIQFSLAKKNIWLRGGVSFGKIAVSPVRAGAGQRSLGSVVVGPGLVNAYELEARAVYPRVIIDPRLVPLLAEGEEDFRNLLNGPLEQPAGADSDRWSWPIVYKARGIIAGMTGINDAIFVDYLQATAGNNFESAGVVMNNLKLRMYYRQEHYQKFRWVADYWKSLGVEFSEVVARL